MLEATLQHLITLVGLTDEDWQVLRESYPITQTWADALAKEFYDVLFAYPPTAQVFQPDERPKREQTLKQWYLTVVRGEPSPTFWEWQWYVGLLHIPRGVINPFMLGMMSRIQQVFARKCLENFDGPKAFRVYTAFKRVTDVVAGLIAESYHLSYIQAMAQVTGIRERLAERIIDLEIQNMIRDARKRLEQVRA